MLNKLSDSDSDSNITFMISARDTSVMTIIVSFTLLT